MFAMSKRKKKLPKLLPSCQRLLRAWSIGLYKLIPSKQLNWHINYRTLYYGKDDTAHFKICPGLGEVGRLPWEQERLLLTVGKSDGFSEMKSKLKAAASGKKMIWVTQNLTE